LSREILHAVEWEGFTAEAQRAQSEAEEVKEVKEAK
jgi:hypothetical protein